MFLLIHLFRPVAKGTQEQCEKMLVKLIENPKNLKKHFLIMSETEFLEMWE